jgi:hypothetical protein
MCLESVSGFAQENSTTGHSLCESAIDVVVNFGNLVGGVDGDGGALALLDSRKSGHGEEGPVQICILSCPCLSLSMIPQSTVIYFRHRSVGAGPSWPSEELLTHDLTMLELMELLELLADGS